MDEENSILFFFLGRKINSNFDIVVEVFEGLEIPDLVSSGEEEGSNEEGPGVLDIFSLKIKIKSDSTDETDIPVVS